MSSSSRPARGSARRRRQRSASHDIAPIVNVATAYTSVSLLFCQLVKVNPPSTAPAAAVPSRRRGSSSRSDSWATRKKQPAPAALRRALRKLVRAANSPTGTSIPHTWAIITYSGVPGGCGIPSTRAAAMNSPASQNVTPGASVSTYPSSTSSATPAAAA